MPKKTYGVWGSQPQSLKNSVADSVLFVGQHCNYNNYGKQ